MKRSTVSDKPFTSGKRARAGPDDDFYASDEDRRLCEFAASISSGSRPDGVCAISAAEIQQHKADDDFVALYDGWEEDMEELIIIPDEGDDAPSAFQHGGFHGFDTSDDEEEDVEVEEEDAVIPADLQQYYEYVQSRRRWVNKFGVFGFATQFCLMNLERIDDVMALVEDIVQHLIDKATVSADREGFKGWIGFGLKTEDGKQWYIPIRPAEQNTAQKIARSIEKYDQSSNTAAFYGKRVTFDITVINEPRGAGGKKGAALTKHLNTNMDNIVKIPLDGRDCLAGLWLLRCTTTTTGRPQRQGLIRGAVERLKYAVNLPDLPAYGIDHARAIQKHLQEISPDKYQIVFFAEKRGITPIWKGDVNNPKHHLYIYLHDKHYDVMKSPERFFGLKNYCVSCEVKFRNVDEHSRLCAIRCTDCLRMGHGYPCQRDTKYDDPKYNGHNYDENGDPIERGPFACRACGREFISKDCFEAHKAMACKTFHRCDFCTNVYRVRNHKKNGGHRCGERFCMDKAGKWSNLDYADCEICCTRKRRSSNSSAVATSRMITTTQKIRGITLDSTNGAALSYDVMRDMVLRQREGREITLKYERIHRDGAFQVSTVDLDKVYRPIFRKGWIDACLSIFPYGYIRAKAAVSNVVNNLLNRKL